MILYKCPSVVIVTVSNLLNDSMTHCLWCIISLWYRWGGTSRAEMGIVGWMCGMGLQDGVPGRGLGERLGLDDMVLVLRWGGLQWCGRVL